MTKHNTAKLEAFRKNIHICRQSFAIDGNGRARISIDTGYAGLVICVQSMETPILLSNFNELRKTLISLKYKYGHIEYKRGNLMTNERTLPEFEEWLRERPVFMTAKDGRLEIRIGEGNNGEPFLALFDKSTGASCDFHDWLELIRYIDEAC